MEISYCNKLYWHKTDSPTQLHHSVFQHPLSRWPIWDGKPPLPSARICVRKVKSRMLLGGLGQLGNKKHCLEILEQLDLFKSKVDYCKKDSKMWLYILQSILETFEKTRTWPPKKQGLFWLCFFRQEQKGWAKNKTVAPAWSLKVCVIWSTMNWISPPTQSQWHITGLQGFPGGDSYWVGGWTQTMSYLHFKDFWSHCVFCYCPRICDDLSTSVTALDFFHVRGMDAEWCGLCWETQRYRGHCAFLKWTFTDFGVRFSLRILPFCTFEQYLWHCAFWVFWIVGWSFGQALEKPDESLRESLLSKADSSFNGPALGAGKFQKKTTET